jgi:acyl-CoA thioester hydrolase
VALAPAVAILVGINSVAQGEERTAVIELVVPYHDVDPGGMVWHGRYAKYFELVRCALLDSFDYGYRRMKESGYNWPIVDLHVRYYRPLSFEQRIRVHARLVEWEYRLRIKYRISDAVTGQRLTRGRSDQVAVDLATGRLCLPCPRVLWERLGCVR